MNPITPDNNLSVHNQGSEELRIRFQVSENDPTPLSMTGKTVFFETNTGIRIALTAGSSSDEMVLLIPQGTFSNDIEDHKLFAVIDETTSNHEVLWEGKLQVRGW